MVLGAAQHQAGLLQPFPTPPLTPRLRARSSLEGDFPRSEEALTKGREGRKQRVPVASGTAPTGAAPGLCAPSLCFGAGLQWSLRGEGSSHAGSAPPCSRGFSFPPQMPLTRLTEVKLCASPLGALPSPCPMLSPFPTLSGMRFLASSLQWDPLRPHTARDREVCQPRLHTEPVQPSRASPTPASLSRSGLQSSAPARPPQKRNPPHGKGIPHLEKGIPHVEKGIPRESLLPHTILAGELSPTPPPPHPARSPLPISITGAVN